MSHTSQNIIIILTYNNLRLWGSYRRSCPCIECQRIGHFLMMCIIDVLASKTNQAQFPTCSGLHTRHFVPALNLQRRSGDKGILRNILNCNDLIRSQIIFCCCTVLNIFLHVFCNLLSPSDSP